MDTSNPAPLLLIGGGVLMIIGSLMKWYPGIGGLETDWNGLFGIFLLLAGAALAVVGALRVFSPGTSLPDGVAGYSLDQIIFTVAITGFLWSFANITEDGVKAGVHLSWIGGALALAGAVMALRQAPGSASGGN